jgi:hypothetical protein
MPAIAAIAAISLGRRRAHRDDEHGLIRDSYCTASTTMMRNSESAATQTPAGVFGVSLDVRKR